MSKELTQISNVRWMRLLHLVQRKADCLRRRPRYGQPCFVVSKT